MRFVAFLILFIFSYTLFSNEQDSTKIYIKKGLEFNLNSDGKRKDNITNPNFKPLLANPYESRLGFIGQPTEERLRMDIGATFDLFRLGKASTFGIDMMTYTQLRSEGRFKFPVETTDYFFGINTAFTFLDKPLFGDLFDGYEQIRIRLAHISSHLIDGYTIDNEFISPPFVFSREFIEFVYRVNSNNIQFENNISPYVGVNYIFSKIPRNIEPIELIAGLDFNYLLIGNIDLSGGYNFALKGFGDNYYGVSDAQIGIKYNFSYNRSILLSLYFHDGLSMHGMFFNQKNSYIGIGTQIYYF